MGKQVVRYRTHEVHNLNELEYINGEVWANIWQVNTRFPEHCRWGESLACEYDNFTLHDKFPLCFKSQFLGKDSPTLSSKYLNMVILSLIATLMWVQNSLYDIVGIPYVDSMIIILPKWRDHPYTHCFVSLWLSFVCCAEWLHCENLL